MSVLEVAVWSACVGVYLSYTLLSVFVAAIFRRAQVLQIGLVLTLELAAVFMASGLGKLVLTGLPTRWYAGITMVLLALSACISTLGLRGFLRAEYRDPIINVVLLASSIVAGLTVVAAAWPAPRLAMEAQAVVIVGVAVVSFWMTLRAWLTGDRFALPMMMACILLIFGISGLYATALGMPLMTPVMQGIVAVVCAAYVVVSFQVLRLRHATKVRMLRSLEQNTDRDLLTQMWTGTALMRKVDEAFVRAKRQRRELIVMGIDFSNAPTIRQTHGAQALDQVTYAMAMRLKHLCGSHLVGRYGQNSFVVVLDTVPSPRLLRSLGLRVAVNLRRPYLIDPDGRGDLFHAELGIGVARLAATWGDKGTHHASDTEVGQYDSLSAAQDVLHDAFELAAEARRFRSRVAIVPNGAREAVGLEQMSLG